MLGLKFNIRTMKIKPISFGLELVWKSNASPTSNTINSFTGTPATVTFYLSYLNLILSTKYSFKQSSLVSPFVKIGIGPSYLFSPKSNEAECYGFFGNSIAIEPIIELSSIGVTTVGSVGFSIKRLSFEIATDFTYHGATERVASIIATSIGLVTSYKFIR